MYITKIVSLKIANLENKQKSSQKFAPKYAPNAVLQA